jgi:single-strand DNA-binding protein
MASYGKLTLMGRVGKIQELRQTQKGVPVINFTLGVLDEYNKNKTNWVNCAAFGKLAEIIEKFSYEKQLVFIEGTLKETEPKTEVTVVNIQFLEKIVA